MNEPAGVCVSECVCLILTGMSLSRLKTWRRHVAYCLLVTNLLPALYTGLVHQRGALDVMKHLQTLCDTDSLTTHPQPDILFLMPCHSTPFYRCFDLTATVACTEQVPNPVAMKAAHPWFEVVIN